MDECEPIQDGLRIITDCCCKCKYQDKLYSRSGGVSKQIGYTCSIFKYLEGDKVLIFYESKHGLCEMFNQK